MRILQVLGAIAALAIAAGCGTGSDERSAEVPSQTAAAGDRDTPSDMRVPPERLAVLLAEPAVDDFQKRLLSDGLLSFADYESAIFATVECMKDAGASFKTPPNLTKRGRYVMAPSAPTDQAAALQPLLSACSESYLSAIGFLWAEHTAPSEVEQQDALNALAACLRGRGFSDVPARPDPKIGLHHQVGWEDGKPTVAYLECVSEVRESTGIEGFSG